MPIGLFFGSFNPIHNGHIQIAKAVLDAGYCDEVWFVVSPQNPFKAHHTLLTKELRYDMVKMALKPYCSMVASDIEFSLPIPSFTIDTINALAKKYPGKEFTIILGGDNLERFNRWKSHQEIAERCNIIVYPRPNSKIPNLPYANVKIVIAPIMDISSTEIRSRIQRNLSIDELVPAQILSDVNKFYK